MTLKTLIFSRYIVLNNFFIYICVIFIIPIVNLKSKKNKSNSNGIMEQNDNIRIGDFLNNWG